jgi:hypothetical protein
MLSGNLLRRLTLGLGIGTVLFSVFPLILPRPFAALFGIPMDPTPASEVVIRSISARDLVSGIGILSAVVHGGRVAPWLLGRTLVDGSDTIGVGLAAVWGARNPRLLVLGAIAFFATVVDLTLYLAHKAAARSLGSRSAV